ncbi:MAG: sugar ABC transporter permease [Clostridiaceae bacterium]|nr:sugar ABC transporter permease [Clostridiaceae bacterium]
MKKKGLNMQQRHIFEGFVFVSPWIIGSIFLFFVPMIQSIRLSFSEITKLAGFQMRWAGLANYKKLFITDVNFLPRLEESVVNTLVNTPIIIIFSLIIAIMINKDIKGRAFFRGAFFLPVLLGSGYIMKQLVGEGVVDEATSVATQFISPDGVLSYLGPQIVQMLNDLLLRITQIFWKSGVQIVLFLAGLQGISPSLYESSKCDGATEWEMFWKITLPLISPVILLNFVYTLIDSFTDQNNPIVAYILDQSKNQQYAYGAAMGWIYFIFVFTLAMIVFAVMKRFTINIGER